MLLNWWLPISTPNSSVHVYMNHAVNGTAEQSWSKNAALSHSWCSVESFRDPRLYGYERLFLLWRFCIISAVRRVPTPPLFSNFYKASFCLQNRKLPLCRCKRRSAACRLNCRCSSDSKRSAIMASKVERPAVKPDCWLWGLFVSSSSGWIRARMTCAKTLPGTERSEIRR